MIGDYRHNRGAVSEIYLTRCNYLQNNFLIDTYLFKIKENKYD